MHGPPLTGWLMIALCASIGGYCLLRTAPAAPSERRPAGQDAFMGLGMAVMALPVAGLGGRPRGCVPRYSAPRPYGHCCR